MGLESTSPKHGSFLIIGIMRTFFNHVIFFYGNVCNIKVVFIYLIKATSLLVNESSSVSTFPTQWLYIFTTRINLFNFFKKEGVYVSSLLSSSMKLFASLCLCVSGTIIHHLRISMGILFCFLCRVCVFVSVLDCGVVLCHS